MYLQVVSAADQHLPIVAVTGHVNGGSDFILKNSLRVPPNDWALLKKIILADARAHRWFTIASAYGTIQDLEIRGELLAQGINPST